MKLDPQQEIFTEILVRLRDEFDVYDGELPAEGVSYPFIYLGDAEATDFRLDKFSVFSEAGMRIHIWHDQPQERGTLSAIMGRVKYLVRDVTETRSYRWIWKDISTQVISNDETGRTLMHGIVDCKFEMIGF